MAAKTVLEASQYEKRMKKLSSNREFRVRLHDIMRQPVGEVEQQLLKINLNTRGSNRAEAERLFRALLRMVGAAEVLWYPATDEADGVVLQEEEMNASIQIRSQANHH